MTFVCAPAGHHLAFIIKHLGLWLHLHNTLYTHTVGRKQEQLQLQLIYINQILFLSPSCYINTQRQGVPITKTTIKNILYREIVSRYNFVTKAQLHCTLSCSLKGANWTSFKLMWAKISINIFPRTDGLLCHNQLVYSGLSSSGLMTCSRTYFLNIQLLMALIILSISIQIDLQVTKPSIRYLMRNFKVFLIEYP